MDPVKRIAKSYSLDLEHIQFLDLDAAEQGHRNASRSLQRILERLAETRYGVDDWRRVVRELSQSDQSEQAA